MLATNFEHRYSFEIVVFWRVTACHSDAYLEAGDSSVLQTVGTHHQTEHCHNLRRQQFPFFLPWDPHVIVFFVYYVLWWYLCFLNNISHNFIVWENSHYSISKCCNFSENYLDKYINRRNIFHFGRWVVVWGRIDRCVICNFSFIS